MSASRRRTSSVLLLVAVFATRNWDAPDLGQKILAKAGEATGARITATGFRFNLLRGVILENVEASSERPGRSLNASLDRLVLEHRVWPLLSGTVAIEQVVLEKPQIEIVEWDAEGGESSSPPKESLATGKSMEGLDREVTTVIRIDNSLNDKGLKRCLGRARRRATMRCRQTESGDAVACLGGNQKNVRRPTHSSASVFRSASMSARSPSLTVG